MTRRLKHCSGFSLIEALVALTVGSVVFGLILTTLLVTQRAGDRLSAEQQVRQEAILMSQSVERVLRYRIAPTELVAYVSPGGGADQEGSPSGGGDNAPAGSNLPASISENLITTETLEVPDQPSPVPTDPGANNSPQPLPTANNDATSQGVGRSRPEHTSAPRSVQPLLTTNSATRPTTTGQLSTSDPYTTKQSEMAKDSVERFSAGELMVYSLSGGPDPARLVTAIRNLPGSAGTGSQVYLEQTAAGNAFNPGTKRRPLGLNSDRFQSQVSFRYASESDGTQARWVREAQSAPRLVEYTVRIWPLLEGAPDFENARTPEGRPLGYQLTSAVAL